MQTFTNNIIIVDITEQSGKNSLMNSMMKGIFQKFIPLPAGQSAPTDKINWKWWLP